MIRSPITNLFKAKNFEVYEEVHYEVRTKFSTRNKTADIIVINQKNITGLVFDSTLRWKTNDLGQEISIDREKTMGKQTGRLMVYGIRYGA